MHCKAVRQKKLQTDWIALSHMLMLRNTYAMLLNSSLAAWQSKSNSVNGKNEKQKQREESEKEKIGEKIMKKFLCVALTLVLAIGCMTGCGSGNSSSDDKSTASVSVSQTNSENEDAGSAEAGTSDFDTSSEISIISREDGSGTRGAFVELFEIQEEDAEGNKVDMTTEEADVTNNTEVMLSSVSGDANAIGYVSLGSINDSVKALKVDGTEATVENIKNGTYKIARPFNIATKEGLSEVAQDFVDYILSADGQAVIEENNYIAVSEAESYAGSKPSGKIVVAGSSSVTPVMEKLKEAYLVVNPNAEIEIQESDSTTGMTSTIDGICDIGMASRELKDSETSEGLISTTIAMDGIAVIINHENPLEDITSEQVKQIYMGESTTWADVQ